MGLGGGDDKAQKQAAAQQAQTTADTQAAISGIDSIFDDPSRQAQYAKLGADTTQFYTNDVNDQNAIAQRQLKFSLARQGLAGGSQQAAEGEQESKDYDKALLNASQLGQQAESGLEQSDETSRMNLINSAETGLDAGNASSEATAQLASNLQSGESTQNANNVANAFGDLSSIYTNSANTKALNQGQLYGYGGLFAGQAQQPQGLYGT